MAIEVVNLYTQEVENIWFGVAYDELEISATTFALKEERAVQNLLESLPFNVTSQYPEKFSPFGRQVVSLLKDVYDGKGVPHSFFPVKSYPSSYAEKVMDVVSLTPVGYVVSYGSVAEVAGGSPRSVGRVMSLNPFPLLVPCHRVVRSDFHPGGYSNGVEIKLEILNHERRGYSSQRGISVGSNRLFVFPVENVLECAEKSKC